MLKSSGAVTDRAPRRWIPRFHTTINAISTAASAILALLVFSYSPPSPAQTDPYRVYGNEIQSEDTNPDIEACEYRELVENQRCNRRANKSACIEEVHEKCRAEYEDRSKASTKEEKP